MAKTTQYGTVIIPAGYPCKRASNHEHTEWPVPLTVRVFRAVVTNKSKGTFRPSTTHWLFGYGSFAYYFEPWPGFQLEGERFGQSDFVKKVDK